MDRFKKLLAAATLLVLPVIAACGEDVMPPPPTGSIVGQVSIEGMGIDGVTVSLSNGASTATAGGGNYRFDNVEQGSYTVTISGFPADASFDATSAPANIGDTGGTVPVDFRGTYIRTASIMGTVTVENMGLGGVTVRISGMADSETATDDSGQYSFTGLRAGTYSVEISGFDSNEVSFSSTSRAATLGVGESKVESFDGTYVRTARIMGQVSVEGEALGGVTVTLMGQGADIPPATTDAGGLYSFSQLRSGDYTVAISGYDTDDYEFETTSKSVTIATGETANVPFDGTLLRTAGIAGRVSVGDMGLDGVTVTLAGAAEMTTETANGGQYSFAGLAAGTYVLSITNPNPTAYNFAEDELQQTVMLEDDDSEIVNFEGTHTRTASVSGMLFIDEVMKDKMHNAGEPSVTAALAPLLPTLSEKDQMVVGGLLAKAKVKLRGPDLNTMTDIAINADGTFSTGASLMAGSYQVELPVNDDDVAAGLAVAGVAFVGESMVVNVEAGGSATVNFPFRITMQTLVAGACMGKDECMTEAGAVAGVELALYANADMSGMLGEATTGDDGSATFHFARADNTGPAGNDNIVFVKAKATGHDALAVSGNDFTEVSYAGTDRISQAPAAVTLVNVAVAFDFWVKSNEMAKDGDMGLGGWNTQVYMGDPEADDAMPLMMVDEDGDTVNATMATDTTKGDNLGKSSFSYTVDPADLPAMFTVMATEGDDAGQPDMGEKWEQGDALTHTHTGLDLPPGKDDDMLDLGPLRVTFTTQSLTVGIHRELDDREGFTDHIGVGDGDDRPMGHADEKVEVSLMTLDSRGRPRVYEYDMDSDPKTDDEKATKSFPDGTGMVTFKNIPTDTEIIAVVQPPSGIITVPSDRYSMELDVYGDHIPEDGVVVGAFGDMGGARPDVWLCPLTVQSDADATEDCSTFAYKWTDGKVSGDITGVRLAKTDKAKVKLIPVSSPYADDLKMEKTVTGKGATATAFEFTGVADGEYKVMLVAEAGKWSEKETKEFEVEHDESKDEVDDGAANVVDRDIDATELRFEIRGVVANNYDGNDRLNRDEAISGVELTLYKAKKGTGTDKARYVKSGSAVGTTETDADGLYVFSDIGPGEYIVEAAEGSNYEAVRARGSSLARGKGKATDVVNMAFGEAKRPSTATPTPVPTAPQWDAANSDFASGNSPNSVSFALLYTNGRLSGNVLDKSTNRMHDEATIELRRCLTIEIEEDPDGDPATDDATAAHRCDDYDDSFAASDIAVRSNGSWWADDLREGYYEAEVDPPGGYGSVDSTGVVPSPATNGSGTGETYWVRQTAELSSLRPRESTETFYIAQLDGNNTVALSDLAIEIDDTTCTGTDVCETILYDVGSVDVEATVTGTSEGALIEIWDNADPTATGAKKLATLEDGDDAEITVKAGPNALYIRGVSESGFTTTATEQRGVVHRNRDNRLNKLEFAWQGGSKTVTRADLVAMDDFLNDEVDATRDIAAGRTAIDVVEVEVSLPNAAGVTGANLALTATAEDNSVTATPTVTAIDASAGAAEGTVEVTLADSDNSANTRTYRVTIKVAAP